MTNTMTRTPEPHTNTAHHESPAPSVTGSRAATSKIKQFKSLVTGEAKLLNRNSVQLMYSMIFPLLIPILFTTLNDDQTLEVLGPMLGPFIIAISVITGVTMASYYTGVSALVNRREEAVLQRMRVGEVSDSMILAAISAPSAILAIIVSIGVIAISVSRLNIGAPEHIWLIPIALIGVLAVSIVFAWLTASFTRTAESAQITSVPYLLIAMGGAIVVLMGEDMPTALYWALNLQPTAPVAHLLDQAWSTDLDWDLIGKSVGFLAAWTLIIGSVSRKRLRWSPRV